MDFRQLLKNASEHGQTLRDAAKVKNVRVLLGLLGPAVRGFVMQVGKRDHTDVPTHYQARFNWEYKRDQPELAKLYAAAKKSQWDGATDLDWKRTVDPHDSANELMEDRILPLKEIPAYRLLPEREKALQRKELTSWLLSQFLHGEQGALYAACQVTQAVGWMDGKFYGSTQVVDEGRHVEVFHRYLAEKMGRIYQINDNLYVIIEALMRDSRWDIKFLGMQIMIEGLALGAFGTMRNNTREPLLKDLLRRVMTDEARHVHFGVVALREAYTHDLPAAEIRDREDWAFEMSLLLRNRFLAHEFYDEYWAHAMTRKAWNELILASEFMSTFRKMMFRRIIPNLKHIHLLSERIRPHYESIGLLEWEHEKAAHELTEKDLVAAN
ncbi:MAG: ferritin-like domain-containing protein [Planctomycetota bacterium]